MGFRLKIAKLLTVPILLHFCWAFEENETSTSSVMGEKTIYDNENQLIISDTSRPTTPSIEYPGENEISLEVSWRDIVWFIQKKNVRSVGLSVCSLQEGLAMGRAMQELSPPIQWFVWLHDLQTNEYKHLVYVNLNCPKGWPTLEEASIDLLLNGSLSWLAWSSVRIDLSDPRLQALNLTINSDVTLAHPDLPGISIEMVKLFKVEYHQPLQYKTLLKDKLGIEDVLTYRTNLRGLEFQAAVVLHQLAVDTVKDPEELKRAITRIGDTHMDSETRFGYSLALHLSEMYNFTFAIIVTNSWGYLKSDGVFDGMIGMLQSGQVQLGITPAVLTPQRMNVVDFTIQTWKLRTCFVFRHPRLLVPYEALFKPFDGPVWLCVVLISVLGFLIFWGIRNWETKIHNSQDGNPLSESLIFVIGLLSQQGAAVELRLVSGRIAMLAGLILSVMLQCFYTSAIVTALLTPIPRTIRTAEDLIKSPLKLGLEDYSYNRATFPKSKDPLTERLYRLKIATHGSGFYSVREGISLVRRQKFAFYSEDSTLYKPIQDTFNDVEICDLSEVELNPASVTASTVLKKSPYRELFNRGFLLMVERGLRSRQRTLWSARRPICAGDTSAIPAVGLDPIFPAHALLLFGIFISLIILSIERHVGTDF